MGDVVDFKNRVEIAFGLLKKEPANSFPGQSALSNALESHIPAGKTSSAVHVKSDVAVLFTTAAIELWMRAIHSFLISAALTETSPIWASVSGYYSSHYTIRAYAHLLGYFQLFTRKKVVHLIIDKNGKFSCDILEKSKHNREHEFYWRIVKAEEPFKSDDLFTKNLRAEGASDCRHREIANYADHLKQFIPPSFNPLTADRLQARLDRLSKIDATVPEIPRAERFPDVDRVQLVAYQRLVHFRQTVDRHVDLKKNRFWERNRAPQWATNWINFQLPERRNIVSEMGQQI